MDERGFFQQSILGAVPAEYRPLPTFVTHRAQPLGQGMGTRSGLPTHQHFEELFRREEAAAAACEKKMDQEGMMAL